MSRAATRLFVFWASSWRPVLCNYLPDVTLDCGETLKKEGQDHFGDLLTEIKGSQGKEDEGVRSYLRKHRTDAYVLVPELSVAPTQTILDRLREVAHILRPVVYTAVVVVSQSRNKQAENLRWTAWILSFLMEVFSEWPQITAMVVGKEAGLEKGDGKRSPIERNERQIRMIKFLLYLLRDPLYTIASKKYLDSVFESLGQWRLLKPLIGNEPSVSN